MITLPPAISDNIDTVSKPLYLVTLTGSSNTYRFSYPEAVTFDGNSYLEGHLQSISPLRRSVNLENGGGYQEKDTVSITLLFNDTTDNILDEYLENRVVTIALLFKDSSYSASDDLIIWTGFTEVVNYNYTEIIVEAVSELEKQIPTTLLSKDSYDGIINSNINKPIPRTFGDRTTTYGAGSGDLIEFNTFTKTVVPGLFLCKDRDTTLDTGYYLFIGDTVGDNDSTNSDWPLLGVWNSRNNCLTQYGTAFDSDSSRSSLSNGDSEIGLYIESHPTAWGTEPRKSEWVLCTKYIAGDTTVVDSDEPLNPYNKNTYSYVDGSTISSSPAVVEYNLQQEFSNFDTANAYFCITIDDDINGDEEISCRIFVWNKTSEAYVQQDTEVLTGTAGTYYVSFTSLNSTITNALKDRTSDVSFQIWWGSTSSFTSTNVKLHYIIVNALTYIDRPEDLDLDNIVLSANGPKMTTALVSGRSNGYTTSNYIDNIAYVIEYLIREELDSTNIDTSSFDAIGNTTNGIRDGWKAEFSIVDSIQYSELFNNICKEFGLVIFKDNNNNFRITSTNYSAVDLTITKSDLLNLDSQIVESTDINNIYNQFILNYYYRGNESLLSLTLDETDGFTYLYDVGVTVTEETTYKTLCSNSQTNYNTTQEKVFDIKYAEDHDTILNILKHYANWFSRKHKIVKLKTSYLQTIALELGDIIAFNANTNLPTGRFIVNGITLNPMKNTMEIEAVEIFEVS